MLVNARHVKNLPGRKTDVADATWLAQLGAHGLVRGSFVPPEPVRQLRDLTRARTAITRERSREAQRLEKLLEDAGIKLSAVASDILGVSGRAMLEALIAGERDPARMADLARRRMRSKIPELTEALAGRFSGHHAFLARVHLDLIDQHTAAISQITARIEVAMEPFRAFRELICSIPGIAHRRRGRRRDRRGHDPVPHRRPPRLMGRDHARQQRVRRQGQVQPHPARQPLPAGSPRRRRHGLRAETPAPTWERGTAGSRHAGDRRRPTSRSSTPCSSRSGTWAPTAPLTRTPAATTSPASAPSGHAPAPSASSRRWATTSPSKGHHDHHRRRLTLDPPR